MHPLPAKPPRSSRYGRTARTKLATVAAILVAASRQSGKDPGEKLTAAIRKATKGDLGLEVMDLEGMGPTEVVDAASILHLACVPLKLDLADERTAEAVEEYVRKCVELYRGIPG